MSHFGLFGLANVRHSLILDGVLDFDCRGQVSHSAIIDVVVVAKPFSFFEICVRESRGCPCCHNFGIVGHLVGQMPPFDMQAACIALLA